jgi:hypothetical protein
MLLVSHLDPIRLNDLGPNEVMVGNTSVSFQFLLLILLRYYRSRFTDSSVNCHFCTLGTTFLIL